MTAHGSGIGGLNRPRNDGTKGPSWNARLEQPPLNQGAQFQQEIVDRRLKSEHEILTYMRERGYEGR